MERRFLRYTVFSMIIIVICGIEMYRTVTGMPENTTPETVFRAIPLWVALGLAVALILPVLVAVVRDR